MCYTEKVITKHVFTDAMPTKHTQAMPPRVPANKPATRLCASVRVCGQLTWSARRYQEQCMRALSDSIEVFAGAVPM